MFERELFVVQVETKIKCARQRSLYICAPEFVAVGYMSVASKGKHAQNTMTFI